MELTNKKIVFLGDSITLGSGASSPELCYVSLVTKMSGCREGKNYGIGVTRFAKQKVKKELWDEQDFCTRVEDLDEDADIIIVFGGTNDFGHGDAPLGQMEDRSPYTFYGACHTLMTRLLERFTEKTIVFITPLHRHNEDNLRGDGEKAIDVAPLSTYVNIIREVAEYYSLPVLDLYANSGIQPKLSVVRERLCPDGIHPNDAGHRIVAEKILAFLRTM